MCRCMPCNDTMQNQKSPNKSVNHSTHRLACADTSILLQYLCVLCRWLCCNCLGLGRKPRHLGRWGGAKSEKAHRSWRQSESVLKRKHKTHDGDRVMQKSSGQRRIGNSSKASVRPRSSEARERLLLIGSKTNLKCNQ